MDQEKAEVAKHRRRKKKKTIEVQCRWTRPIRENQGPIFDWMAGQREWHKYRCYESVDVAEQAVQQLNLACKNTVMNGVSFRSFEYRVNPDHLPQH